MKARSKKLLLGGIIFATVCGTLITSVDTFWFKTDDLGCIISGLVNEWNDIPRIFSDDERSYTTAANLNVPTPNVFSGFLRPIQHLIFTVIYKLFGLNAFVYFATNVIFHALCAVLLFYLFSCFLPLPWSFFGALVYAWYPDIGWFTWISTLQNILSLFFMLLVLLVWFKQCVPRTRIWQRLPYDLFVGTLFLLSLLSRESAQFTGACFVVGTYLFCTSTNHGWWYRIGQTLSRTWIFFVASCAYICLKIHAFGIQSVHRTLYNLSLRYPLLKYFVNQPATVTATAVVPVAQTPASVIPSLPSLPMHQEGFLSHITMHITNYWGTLKGWVEPFTTITPSTITHTLLTIIILCFVGYFLWYAYRNNRKILLFLMFTVTSVLWPGIVAYPNPRYFHLAYPLLIFMLLYGCILVQYTTRMKARILVTVTTLLMIYVMVQGLINNRAVLRHEAHNNVVHQQRFDEFFKHHSLQGINRVILLNTPYESDIQGIFRACTGNLTLSVMQEPFATLAEHGMMGCKGDNRIQGVASNVIPIEGGYRLISQDPDHCGWWMHYSYYPLAWSPEQKAYVWSQQPYEIGSNRPCSIGMYTINAMNKYNCVIDISFIIDSSLIDEHTIFVTWDTMAGKYMIMPIHSDKIINSPVHGSKRLVGSSPRTD